MIILFEIAIVLIISVVLKKLGNALCMCVEREPFFFGLFRIPKNVWWHIFSFLLTYYLFSTAIWLLVGPCGDKKDITCASACINKRVHAVKMLLDHEYYCPSIVSQPATVVEMILDGYWH